MDREERARALARQRRRRSQRRLTLVLAVLVVAAAVLALIYGLQSCRQEGSPSQTTSPAPQTQAVTQAFAPETEASGQIPETLPPETEAPSPETTQAPAPEDESWKLLLVNRDHPLPEGFTVELKALRNGQNVDARIYPELQQMFDDARAAGIYPLINESYRTTQRQQEIMEDYIARYEVQGMSHEAAVEKAETLVAIPGTSEHELGLALDIINEAGGDDTPVWNWLRDNCWRYGFILRYPADKEEITGIEFEPWHFRYVGVPTAQEITEAGLCLEEYLEGQEGQN